MNFYANGFWSNINVGNWFRFNLTLYTMYACIFTAKRFYIKVGASCKLQLYLLRRKGDQRFDLTIVWVLVTTVSTFNTSCHWRRRGGKSAYLAHEGSGPITGVIFNLVFYFSDSVTLWVGLGTGTWTRQQWTRTLTYKHETHALSYTFKADSWHPCL